VGGEKEREGERERKRWYEEIAKKTNSRKAVSTE
jgi:hypothetical protein